MDSDLMEVEVDELGEDLVDSNAETGRIWTDYSPEFSSKTYTGLHCIGFFKCLN